MVNVTQDLVEISPWAPARAGDGRAAGLHKTFGSCQRGTWVWSANRPCGVCRTDNRGSPCCLTVTVLPCSSAGKPVRLYT